VNYELSGYLLSVSFFACAVVLLLAWAMRSAFSRLPARLSWILSFIAGGILGVPAIAYLYREGEVLGWDYALAVVPGIALTATIVAAMAKAPPQRSPEAGPKGPEQANP
jgi:hypothetical protein